MVARIASSRGSITCSDGRGLCREVYLLESESEVKQDRPYLYLEKREVLVLKSDWDELAEALGQPSQFECLCGHLLKDGVSFKLIDMLLPFLGSAKVAQIGEEQVYL